ncbi:hypothetical protein [Streptomyces sp. XY332]|uniref:hypothetical protein n=1 Tax=Streptomyces sp. XY332 TaxID=1415561 RepID=UPI0006B1CBB8|nr:hypothetical protein [Streptomyces sp. XY332]KOY55972.1 hypothetical protein ADK59_21515 [Streptomyces sp. XY332]
MAGLFWDDPDDLKGTDPTAAAEGERPAARGFPDDPAAWRPRVLLLSAPDEVSELVRAGRPTGFDAAAALLREWGDVATEAGARRWGLVGLPF